MDYRVSRLSQEYREDTDFSGLPDGVGSIGIPDGVGSMAIPAQRTVSSASTSTNASTRSSSEVKAKLSKTQSNLEEVLASVGSRASIRQPGVTKTSCCFGFCHYDVPSATCQELIQLEKKITGSGPKGRLPFVDSMAFSIVFGVVIILNSLCIGLDIMLADEDGNSAQPMVVLETLFLIAFWVELGCRIFSHGFIRFSKEFWGPFDFGVTFLGSVDAWLLTPLVGSTAALSGVSALRTLRRLRLFRLIRVFRAFSQLARLVKVLIGAFQSLTWVTLLLFIILYTSVIIVRLLLVGHEDDSPDLQNLTKGIGWTLFFHTMLVTCEGHLDTLVGPTVVLNKFWYVYWVAALVFLNFVMVNLMVGLIVQKTMQNTQDEEQRITSFVHEAEQFKRTLLTLFNEKDVDEDGYISVDELYKLMSDDTMTHIMATFGIKTDLPQEFMLQILGFQGEKYVSFTRFYESCVRMCGASRDIRSFMLQFDITRFQKEIYQSIGLLGKRLGHKASAALLRKSQEGFQVQSLSRELLEGQQVSQRLPSAGPAPRSLSPPTSFAAAQRLAVVPTTPRGGAGAGENAQSSTVPSRRIFCSSKMGGGFSERFQTLAFKAKKKLSTMERRQEEMVLSLCELRAILYGASHRTVICCKMGHPLMPLGTGTEPVGSAEYRNWTCDYVGEPGGCRHGNPPGSHLTRLRRYHCAVCKYDLCEDCYNALQSERGVGKLSTTPPASRNASREASPSPPDIKSQPAPIERTFTVDTPPCEGN